MEVIFVPIVYFVADKVLLLLMNSFWKIVGYYERSYDGDGYKFWKGYFFDKKLPDPSYPENIEFPW